jgi:hypothetical protein
VPWTEAIGHATRLEIEVLEGRDHAHREGASIEQRANGVLPGPDERIRRDRLKAVLPSDRSGRGTWRGPSAERLIVWRIPHFLRARFGVGMRSQHAAVDKTACLEREFPTRAMPSRVCPSARWWNHLLFRFKPHDVRGGNAIEVRSDTPDRQQLCRDVFVNCLAAQLPALAKLGDRVPLWRRRRIPALTMCCVRLGPNRRGELRSLRTTLCCATASHSASCGE